MLYLLMEVPGNNIQRDEAKRNRAEEEIIRRRSTVGKVIILIILRGINYMLAIEFGVIGFFKKNNEKLNI